MCVRGDTRNGVLRNYDSIDLRRGSEKISLYLTKCLVLLQLMRILKEALA